MTVFDFDKQHLFGRSDLECEENHNDWARKTARWVRALAEKS